MGNVNKEFLGTPFHLVLQFTGEYSEVKPSDRKYYKEKLFRQMSETEIKLYTLWQRKIVERDGLIQKVCGVSPVVVKNADDRAKYVEVLNKKVSHEQKAEIISAWMEGNLFKNNLWDLILIDYIKTRNFPHPMDDIILVLKPGWQIFACKWEPRLPVTKKYSNECWVDLNSVI